MSAVCVVATRGLGSVGAAAALLCFAVGCGSTSGATANAGSTGHGATPGSTTSTSGSALLSPAPGASASSTETAQPANKTGPVTIRDSSGGTCTAFTLAVARQVLPELPDQQMDSGDGNCSFYLDPNDLSAGGISFVRPHVNQPNWEAQAQQTATSSGTPSSVTVGDVGFCAPSGSGNFWLGWQRGSTGLEIDAGGRGVDCDTLTRLALILNASL